MKLLFTPEARRDLEAIGDRIATENPRRAETFVEELKLSCFEILNFPEKYSLAQGYEKKGLRRKVHGNYLIIYRIQLQQIVIIHIQHGSKELGS